ncbi:MAG: flagellar protein FliT [Lachnospiraceae bacterium]|jgi:predicted nuclease with TOPRIM domain|nr:flagellar protein FliT [Lachnospiraceae bacterium]
MTGNYLTLLEESLRRKLQVMEEIQKYNMRQQEIFQSGEVDIDKFDEYVAEKGVLIDKLTALDSGFEKLYAKVSEELQGSREQYADQIRTLQGLVTQVTDRSVDIQAQEARNKKLVEDFFRRERDGIKIGRKSTKAAIGYYKTMSKTAVVAPQFMDSKK